MTFDLEATGLVATPDEVARLTLPQREDRVVRLVILAHELLDYALTELLGDKHDLKGIFIGYSGGNDSTTLAHLMRETATAAFHANTGIGIEETRQFVRDTCATWGLPLIEKHLREQDSYRSLVLAQGFPGPAQHFKMYQRLKERSIRALRNDYVTNPRRERIVLLAGRRRSESSRRAEVPEMERAGSIVWVSPLVLWTKLDLNTYRLMHDVPSNRVSDLIHMSGECLCGSFAEAGELEEIAMWFPHDIAVIAELEEALADRTDIPEIRRKWGWGAYRSNVSELRARARAGAFCTSCDARANGGEILEVSA